MLRVADTNCNPHSVLLGRHICNRRATTGSGSLHIDDDRLRVVTLEFLVKDLVARISRDNPAPDLKQDVLGALERLRPPFASDDVERAAIRARMCAEAQAILNWAMDGQGTAASPIQGRPLPSSRYRQWR